MEERQRRLAGISRDLAQAWRYPAVKRGFVGTLCIFIGSLTPAYLPQNSPWWGPMRALGLDAWPFRVLGTAVVIAGMGLLVSAWFGLRPTLYHDIKHWTIFGIWSAPLLISPPTFSHDAYGYAALGWLLRNGLNPYENPISVLPGAFADQFAWAWRYDTSMYPPLSLQIFHGVVALAQNNPYVSAVAMRIPALIGVALIVYLLPRLARQLGADPQLTAWFATINPILIIDFVGGAHNDALMMGMVVTALWLAVRGWFWPAAVAVGVAASLKQPGILAFYPVALLGHPWLSFRWRDSLRSLGRLAGSLAIAALTFVGITQLTGLGYGWIYAADVPGKIVTIAPFSLLAAGVTALLSWWGQPEVGELLARGIRGLGLLATAAVMLWLGLGIGRRRPVTFLSWSWLAFAFGGLSLHSWYLTWGGLLLPLIRPDRKVISGAVIATTTLLAYAAGGLAWFNDAVGLALAGGALLFTLAWRHHQEHKEAAPQLEEIR
ncbi:MAG: polyprenol phosphomannose-dependent alpha 1,6 mannosyltransferase MptB [Propionicimonas sp.]